MEYQSSKGAVEISTMPLSHAKNALNKLRRGEPERFAEIEALDAHVSKLEADAIAGVTTPKPRAAVIGDNGPPADGPVTGDPSWTAVQVHMDDLLGEASNWADGMAVENQDQADTIATLRQRLQDAANLADKARIAEKKPLDEAIAEIQDRYNAYIAPLKNKKPGSVSKATAALGNLLTGWLNKLEADRRARETAAREEADRIAAAAREAHQEAARSTDLGAIEEAGALMEQAEQAEIAARSVEREKVQARGEVRAIGMRSYWQATPVEGQGGKALVHYAQRQPERVKAFLQQLADEDVRAGIRTIPGFTITEERKVA